MQQLIRETKNLVANEYYRASTKFGCINHSDHESFAVIAEEVEEARDEFINMQDAAEAFWKLVKSDSSADSKIQLVRELRQSAILAACEAIQVAAMAYKAEQTILHKGELQ